MTTASGSPIAAGADALGPAAPDRSGAAPAPPSAGLVEQTRREIQQIAAEIGELARQDIPPAEFYGRFLPSVVSALGALGGAIWTVNEAGELALQFQANLASAHLDDDARRGRHTLLLRKTIADGEPLSAAPHSGPADDLAAGNPTDHLLLLAPLQGGERVLGVVEVFQRSDAGPATQRGYLRFLVRMTELASGYLKGRSLRKFSDRQQLWQQLERFISRIHGSLDPRTTAYTIANEGRRLIECDRLSVLVRRGRSYRAEAVSGVDRVDPRAVHIRTLQKLVAVASATGEPLWYRGQMQDVPPQIEAALHQFVDETHAHTIAILPLSQEPSGEDDVQERDEPQAAPIGALVVEQFQSQDAPTGFAQRAQAVADHGRAALGNALEHRSIFLFPLWHAVGKLSVVVAARNLPKTLTALPAVACIAAVLAFVPADFEVEGRGALEPCIRRDVFAGVDGQVTSVAVAHGQEVAAGQTLLRMRGNSDLDVSVADLVGKKLAARQRIAAIERELLGERKQNPQEQDQLSGELFQLNKTVESLEKQLSLYEQKQQELVVTSPIDGQIVTWQVRERLGQRPVRQGQSLMTVVDPTGDWELEVHMPQRRIGHVARAAADADEPLPVTFMLATHPGQEFTGHVKEIGQVADAGEGQDPTVLIRVAIDKVELPELRPGATVSARVDCGRRSLGYVWLHDVVEFVQSQILFRL